jgi:outer membrane protein OmpA-like peptidoglycan-associated protein
MKVLKWILAIAALGIIFAPFAQAQTVIQVQRSGDAPIYKITVNVVERTTTAVNYRHRGGSTRLDFRGTPLLPGAHGEAEIESHKGYIGVKTEIKDLKPASSFGPEYLTYVLWAITPEGRPVNLGEVLLDGNNRGALDVTTDLQAFGLIVTAEPYFGVTQPSDLVVVENVIRKDTQGGVEAINAKYELLQRGQYTTHVPAGQLTPIVLGKNSPLYLYEAQNAVRIARWAAADKDAADSFVKAQNLLQQAEAVQLHDPGSKAVSTAARGAVQAAEDARLIALKRQEEARLESERHAAAERQARIERERLQAERERVQAEEQKRLEAERRVMAEAERAKAQAEAEIQRNKAAAATAQAAREREVAQAEVERANQLAEQAKQDQLKMRQQLVEQFNRVLETRESTRGLIVNMSGVWFDTGSATLKTGAREKLAKIASILSAHPNLKIEVEGHTDNTGSEDTNLVLSEHRSNSVREFLVLSGVNSSAISARGMGESQPVASNETAAGRQLNRRVEMVVSGDIIGTPISSLR